MSESPDPTRAVRVEVENERGCAGDSCVGHGVRFLKRGRGTKLRENRQAGNSGRR
jgi:hypothetical protein